MADRNRSNEGSPRGEDGTAKREDSLDRGSNFEKSKDDASRDASPASDRKDRPAEVDPRLKAAQRNIQRSLDTAYDRSDNLISDVDAVKLLREVETAANVVFDRRLLAKYNLPAKYDIEVVLSELSELITSQEPKAITPHPIDNHSEIVKSVLDTFYEKDGSLKKESKPQDFLDDVSNKLDIQFSKPAIDDFSLTEKLNLEQTLEELKEACDKSPDFEEKYGKFGRFERLVGEHNKEVEQVFRGYLVGKDGKAFVDDLPAVMSEVLDVTGVKIVAKEADKVINSVFDDVKTFFSSQSQEKKEVKEEDKKVEDGKAKEEDKKTDSKKEDDKIEDSKKEKEEEEEDAKREEKKEEKKEEAKKEAKDEDAKKEEKDKATPESVSDKLDFDQFNEIFKLWFERNHRDLEV
eukprot:CAMPEP_0115021698 /NCGR_PEP_ID=MMETSP0216-20121206/31063_1 /TAXON_ID=223996 /ORGANISM="Protocruzia adherens, Strain Boccale" /LENGTH=405 /DNA_ID=CAMNT_0002394147 /DNA_START=68 /DNA_END=1282 /DNA_ORIENTATION=-